MLARSDFAGARTVLAEIEHEADPDTLADLRSRIDADEAEHLLRIREMRMQEGVSRARQQMQANQLTEAEETLRSLLEEFPDSTGAGKLLAAIQEHLEAQKRVEIVNNLTQQALGLIQAQQFLDACLVLGDGLQKYPDDFALQRLLDRAVALQRAHSRAKAIEKVIEEAHQSRAAERLDEALAKVDSALAEHGHDSALMDLKRQVEFEQEQKQHVSGVLKALTAGHELMDGGRFSDAVAALERSVAEYPGEPNLASLLHAARQAKTEQDEQQFVDDVTARFEELERGQKLQEAVDCIEEALQRYPYNTKLFGLGSRAKESRRQQQRSENIARRSAMIEQAIAGGDWSRAELGLRTARQDFPGESVFGDLDEKFRQAQQQAELKTLASQVRQSLAHDDLEGASRQLGLAQALSGEALWQTLQQELEQQRTYRNRLQQARELEQRGDYQAAEDLLEQLLRENPSDGKGAALLKTIGAQRRSREREEAIARGLEEIEAETRAQNFSAAIKAADRLAREYRGDPRIAQMRSQAETAQRRMEQERAYRQALDEAEGLRVAGKYDQAEELLRKAVRQALDSRAEGLLKTVVAEKSEFERQARLERTRSEIRGLVERGNISAALDALGRVQRDFPGDPVLAELRTGAEQQQAVSNALLKMQDLERRKQPDAALEVVLDALQKAPENLELTKASQRLREWVRQAALDRLAETIHFCLDRNELQRAAEALDSAQRYPGDDSLWQTLHGEVEQRLAYEGLLQEAERCRQQSDYGRAEQLLRTALEQRADPRVNALLAALADERARTAREQAIREGRQQVSALTAKGDNEGALRLVEELLREYPDEGGLTQDRRDALRRIEVQFVNETLAQIAALQKQQQWDAALAQAEKAAANYPQNRELAVALRGIRETVVLELRREEIGRLVRQAESELESRRWSAAEETLRAARQQFSGEKIFEQLWETLRKRKRESELDALKSLVSGYFYEGNLDEAARQIDNNKAAFSDEPVWQNLNSELELRRTYVEALRSADQQRRDGRHEAAEAALRQVIAKGPLDTRAAVLLQAITAERLQQQRQAAILRARQEAERLVRSGKPAEALGVLDRICHDYPDDSALAGERNDLDAKVRQQRQEAQRQELERRHAAERARKVAAVRAAVAAPHSRTRLGAALAALDLAQQEFPGEQTFVELRRQVTLAIRQDAWNPRKGGAGGLRARRPG